MGGVGAVSRTCLTSLTRVRMVPVVHYTPLVNEKGIVEMRDVPKAIGQVHVTWHFIVMTRHGDGAVVVVVVVVVVMAAGQESGRRMQEKSSGAAATGRGSEEQERGGSGSDSDGQTQKVPGGSVAEGGGQLHLLINIPLCGWVVVGVCGEWDWVDW